MLIGAIDTSVIEAAAFQPVTRDLAAEAYENGHPHCVVMP